MASFGTLLAAPGPCEQQNAADNMVDLAKTLNNNANMIALAQIFAQQPRNSVRLSEFSALRTLKDFDAHSPHRKAFPTASQPHAMLNSMGSFSASSRAITQRPLSVASLLGVPALSRLV